MLKLDVKEISKTYYDKKSVVKALVNVSFQLHAGEVLALLGPNGSGKTTTIDCIAGLITPDSGTISNAQNEKLRAGEVGCIAGDAQYFWMYTGRQILMNYSRLYGVDDSRRNELVAIFSMESKLDRKWHTYSNGEKMKIRVIRALLNDPEVLILDEPSVGLDPSAVAILREELGRLRDSGRAILLTSHHMGDVESLANRICFLNEGSVVAQGVVTDFTKPRDLLELEYSTRVGEAPDWLQSLGDNKYMCPIQHLKAAVEIASVVSIHSVTESLEEYFIRLYK